MAMSRTRLLCNSCATGADLGFKTKERAQSFVFQFTCFIVMGLSSFLSSEKRLLSRAQIRIKPVSERPLLSHWRNSAWRLVQILLHVTLLSRIALLS